MIKYFRFIKKTFLIPVLVSLKYNVNKIPAIINFLLPLICIFVGQYVYKKRGFLSIGLELLIPIIAWIIQFIIYSLLKLEEYKKYLSIPISKKRFTIKLDNGDIEMNKEDLDEAVIYLNEVECYLRNAECIKN